MTNNTQSFTIQKTARYSAHGNPEKAKHLLIALHGYGQLVPYFIRKFQMLDADKYYVICPEGPHRFYLKGTSGRVGASWMTKESRDTDIQDYVQYLDQLMDDIKEQYKFESTTLLGFSQGGATASRWLAYGGHQFDRFLLWAAVFPPDMDSAFIPRFDSSHNYWVIGSNDQFIDEEKAEQYFDQLKTQLKQVEIVKFEGKHDIDAETLKALLP